MGLLKKEGSMVMPNQPLTGEQIEQEMKLHRA